MKKILMSFLALTMILSGCSGQTTKETSTSTNQSETTINNKKMGTIHLTKEAFLAKVANFETNPNEWKYLGDKPCMIDFYADWCGPCKAVAPILEELAKTYDGQIYIYKINTDKEQELAGAFGIRSIPSLLFVPMEGKPQMSVGALPKQQMIEAIDKVLLGK
jgi:thioredoxin